MSFNPIRSITLSNVFRVLGITLAICLVFGIVDSGVSWAGTPVVRNIPTTNSSAHSFLISLAVNPTTDTVYAANGHSISVISGKTDKVTHTILAKSAGLAVNPTTDTVYAANGHSISVISGKTDKVVRSIRMRYNVVGLAVNPTTDTVYAATYEDSYATYLGQAPESTLSVINGVTDKVTHTVDLNSQVLALAVNPTTDTVYAADDTVSVMNGATGKVTHTIHGDPGFPSFFFNLAVNPTTDTVYAANGHSIWVISGKTDKVTHTILAKSAGLAVNPTTDTVYAANGHSISVISGATSKLVRSIRARSNVVGFSVNPTTDTVYATNRNSVSVIALATGSQTSDSRVIIGLAAVGLVIVVGGATFLVALKRRRAA